MAAESQTNGPGDADTGGEPGGFRHALGLSPALYPLAIDLQTDNVQFMHLAAADYAEASFLDARVTTPATPAEWHPWADVRGGAAGLSPRCHYIFHISHVGSTLLSRLIGHHPGLFSVREPAVLRTLADAQLALGQPAAPWGEAELAARTAVYLSLWSRTFDPGQTAVIKATSFVGEMSRQLLELAPDSRAVFMYVPPVTFLKALLNGAMSDITGAAGKRLFRLHRRLGAVHWRLQDLSPGETVAMSWLCEMLALSATAARFPARVLWVDFDRFLRTPAAGLAAVIRHFGADGTDETAAAILSGPTMTQYAKAPSQNYDAGLRERILRQGEERHAAEIHKGMEWLNRAGAIPGVTNLFRGGRSAAHVP